MSVYPDTSPDWLAVHGNGADPLPLALCVPAYNAAWCLPRLLASAAAQTRPFAEVLVYDDASSDDTAAVARAYGARVIRGETNRGCAHGKNALAGAAQAPWLHFHDADDDLLPNFSRVAERWLARADAPDVVLLSYEFRDNSTGELLAVRTFDDARVSADAVAFTVLEQINNFGLYRRGPFLAAGGYDTDPRVLYNEDVAMHVRLALAGLSFRAEHEPTGISYRVGGSMSAASQARCLVAQYHVLRNAAARIRPSHRAVVSARLWGVAGGAGSHLDWSAAHAALALAVELGGRIPQRTAGSLPFRAVAAVAPRLALHARERLVRRTRAELRPAPETRPPAHQAP